MTKGKLFLLPRRNTLREELETLDRMKNHIDQLQEIYAERRAALAKKLVGDEEMEVDTCACKGVAFVILRRRDVAWSAAG